MNKYFRSTIELRGKVVSISASYSRGLWFKFKSRERLFSTGFRGVPKYQTKLRYLKLGHGGFTVQFQSQFIIHLSSY
jgi:hypothetical protein